MEIKNETKDKFELGNNTGNKDFFNSIRVKTYINRLIISCIFIIALTLIKCYMWNKLNFYEIQYDNWIIVMIVTGLMVFTNLAILLLLGNLRNYLDSRVVNKIKFIFYFSLFNFLLSLTESLITLFKAYLSYFECIYVIYINKF
jgi:hypothetical protein